MKALNLWFLLCLQWLGVSWSYEHVSKSALEETLASHDFVLVAFFLAQEEKSSALLTEWQSAVSAGTETLINFDCTEARETCQESGVQAYPEIHLFQGGKRISRYDGPRRDSALLHFVARMRRPVISEATAEDVASFKTADETVFLAYIDPSDENSQNAFGNVARQYHQEFTFGLATPGLEPPSGLKAPVVICYKPVDGDTVSFTSFDKPDELENWVKEASRPVIGELTRLNQQRLLDRGWPMVYLFAPTEAERQDVRKSLYRFAKNYYDSLTTVLVDPLEFPDLMPKLGLEPGVYPAGAVHQLTKDRVYPYPKGLPYTSNAVQKWGLDVYQGRIKPWTPPGVTTTYDDLGPTVVATRKVSIAAGFPGVKIKVAGHDEL